MTSCFDEPFWLTAGVARLFYLFSALREKNDENSLVAEFEHHL